jgi:archaellum biogenesis protein FlaJ (TadC family)
MFVGTATTLIQSPIIAMFFVTIFTLVLLVMQNRVKPFCEAPEEAGHWSSPNKMAELGYICQLVILMVGLVAILGAPLGDALSLVLALPALAALVIPITLTVIIIRGVDVGGEEATGVQVSEPDETAVGDTDDSATIEDPDVAVENPAVKTE